LPDLSGGAMAGGITQMMMGPGSSGLGSASGGLRFFERTYTVAWDPSTGRSESVVAFAPWVYHFALSWALAILCVLLASAAVAPVNPWRAWRSRRRARARRAAMGVSSELQAEGADPMSWPRV